MMSITDTINSPVGTRDSCKSQPETTGASASREKDGNGTGNRSLVRGKGKEGGDKDGGTPRSAAETHGGGNSKSKHDSRKPRRDTSGASKKAKPCPSPVLPAPERPRLVPLLLWDRLSLEFNPSQLRAVWAAVATVRETQQERERERERVRKREREENAASTKSKNADSSPSAPLASSNDDPTGDGGDGLGGGGGSTRGVLAEGGVVLLQGPPGTGKTRTVLGVVSAILAREKEKAPGTGAAGAADGGNGGLGMTLEVRAKQKRPGGAARLAAAKTHQRVSVILFCFLHED